MLRERLADELGADPSAETQALHTAILRGEMPPAAMPPQGRAAQDSGFVGRHAQLQRLDDAAARAREGVVQYVVVDGEAGIGKTRLVRSWASRRPTGDVVLFGTCGDLASSAPLDPLLTTLAAYLRTVGDDRTAVLLGTDAPLLAPLLGNRPAAALPALMADAIIGPTLLYTALAGVVERLSRGGLVVLVLDDAHRGGPALGHWLAFVMRSPVPLLVVATVRTPAPPPVPGGQRLVLGPLDEQERAELVGTERSRELHRRSGGHPLFLTELALSTDGDDLPLSLVEAVVARCDQLGRAGWTLRSAAVVGSRLDLDLLASVLNRPAVELHDAEVGVRHRLLDDDAGTFCFHHALVREALSASASAARSAWMHRQVSRVMSRRPDADPAEVAQHARLGSDVALAARALGGAARRAAERFDHATAQSLLDDALALDPGPESWLARARVRTRRGNYTGAYRDVERARGLGAAAFEVGAWASYFDRRFDQALAFAADGTAAAYDQGVRGRCLTIGGRTHHARGDLAAADEQLGQALESAHGADRVMASAWLGVLRSHQSRPADAIRLLRPATSPELPAEHTSALLHALLFTGHAHALAGRPADALDAFARYTAEAERRHVPRFDGRGTNFSGWVLRSLGAADEAAERHDQALAAAAEHGTAELRIAALEDLAEDRIERGDLDAAARLVAEAAAGVHGDLVFGWRLALRLELLRARLACAEQRFEEAAQTAAALALRAGRLGVPRYAAVARLVEHEANRHLGAPVDLDEVARDLDELDRVVALEAWWWTGQAAAAHGVPAWVERAGQRAAALAAAAGERGPALRRVAADRAERWRRESERPSARREHQERHDQRR